MEMKFVYNYPFQKWDDIEGIMVEIGVIDGVRDDEVDAVEKRRVDVAREKQG
jgi:hypothetical protein